MADRIPWTERTFDFGFPVGLYHEILERIRGTPARVEELVRAVPKEIMTRRDGNAWSIQENVGHLLDVEELWLGRLDDYDHGAQALRPADMTNRQTHAARHNEKPIESILSAFRRERIKLVRRLEQLEPDRFGQTATHPRLGQPMRIVDMMYFVAEHDDYHLARITELTRKLR
ncbi:MAG: DinB family protein [Phycisphaerae bacterium]